MEGSDTISKSEWRIMSRELSDRILRDSGAVKNYGTEEPVEPVAIATTPPQVDEDDYLTLADRLYEEPDRISGLSIPEQPEQEFRPALPRFQP